MQKFILSAASFARALAKVTPVIANHPVVPVLSNVLLRISGDLINQGTMMLICSNLETTLTATVRVECEETFDLCVDGKMLLNTLKGFPDAPVTCTYEANTYAFVATVGKSKYRLAGENTKDFPRMPGVQAQHKSLVMPANLLREALTSTLPFTSNDENRPAMTGVFVEAGEGAVRFTATDGHRLNVFERPLSDAITASKTGTALLPRSAAGLLLSLLDPKSDEPVELLMDATNVRLADNRWITRLVDDRYPEYRNVIPVSNPHALDVDSAELLTALRRLQGYANKTTKQVVFSIAESGEVELMAEDLDYASQGTETVQGDYQGEPLTIGFNAAFLMQSLALFPDARVRFAMSTPASAAIITRTDEVVAPGLMCLVMPVQVNQYI